MYGMEDDPDVRNLATREVKIAVVYACCEIRM
jgi:hypothetical protein